MTDPSHHVGQRISYSGALCTVRYIGEVAGTSGTWLGVEWDDATRGKHNGQHKGERYFTCLSKSSTAASFVRPSRPAEEPRSFLQALRYKYASDTPRTDGEAIGQSPIVISGKVAEELGFDKVRQRLARLEDLQTVILDDLRVATATAAGDGSVEATCPRVIHADLSRNLFERIGRIVEICAGLKVLRHLSLNGNRFQDVLMDETLRQRGEDAFAGVVELALGETLLSWPELCCVAARCPSLSTLYAGMNQLSTLPSTHHFEITGNLTFINLEYNEFTALSDFADLTGLKSLRNLHLKGNNISKVADGKLKAPIFPTTLHFLDLSYNQIETWNLVDDLAPHFPGLTGLRLSHNPIYDNTGLDSAFSASDESHMITVGRIAQLKNLNYSQIHAADRANAEMFYLSRIAKELSTVPQTAAHTILALHPRFDELCKLHGSPDVARRRDINPSFLETRLITICFLLAGKASRTFRVPKSRDIYAVRGIAGKLFGLSPLRLRLIWETGEWDPVADYDRQDGMSSGEEELRAADAYQGEESPANGENRKGKSGRWIRREVELADGPRQLGYCVDGMDVRIRVEL